MKRKIARLSTMPKLPDRRAISDAGEYLIELDKVLKKRELANK